MAKGWIQAVVLVSVFGFTVLGYMAARTYQAEPPIPDRVVTSSGTLLFTGNDVRAGQDVFLRNGLRATGPPGSSTSSPTTSTSSWSNGGLSADDTPPNERRRRQRALTRKSATSVR